MIESRIVNAYNEMRHISKYDYLLINDDFNETLKNLISIANVARVKSSLFNLDEVIKKWKDLSF